MTEIVSFARASLLLKAESTYGTNPTPTGADNSILITNGRIRFQANKLIREIDRTYFGARPFVLTGRQAFIEFDIEIMGAADPGDAAPVGPVFLTCGHAQTLVADTSAAYNPISAAFGSTTGYFTIPAPDSNGAQQHIVTGLRGSINWTLQINNYAKGRVVLQGQEAIISNTAFPTQTLSAFQDPVGIDVGTWSVTADDGGGSFALDCVEIGLDQGNRVQIYETSEQKVQQVVGRDTQGFLRIHLPRLTDFDPYALAVAKTPVDIQSVISGGAGKIATLSLPQVQFDLPERIDIDGAVGLRIPFSALPTATGNDEYEWIFT